MNSFLIQILLPVYDQDGTAFDAAFYREVRRELVDRFGGVTAYTRAPASGAWTEDDGSVVRDDIFIYEVMTDDLDRAWWAAYRERLRQTFRQQELIVRCTNVVLL